MERKLMYEIDCPLIFTNFNNIKLILSNQTCIKITIKKATQSGLVQFSHRYFYNPNGLRSYESFGWDGSPLGFSF